VVDATVSNRPRNRHAAVGFSALLLTAVAMLAFAGNSLLCRLALRPHAIDPTSFTLLRVVAGAVTLSLLCARRPTRATVRAGSWRSALALAGYAIAFALAYVALDAATGTLVLFGAVQVTMLAWGLAHGERPPRLAWAGFVAATAGLALLLVPGVSAPDPAGLALMAVAGISWGVYSLRGRGVADPVAATTSNFLRAAPLCLLASVAALCCATPHFGLDGVVCACVSGAITSGLGYVIWYAAVRKLSATQAAMAQLTVPVLAAVGGVILLGEAMSPRLLLAAVLVLGGVATAVLARRGSGGAGLDASGGLREKRA
jgi:drug/metabolite transporter (DMT)-like permease